MYKNLRNKGKKAPIPYSYIYNQMDEDPKSLWDKGSRELALKSTHGGRNFPQNKRLVF